MDMLSMHGEVIEKEKIPELRFPKKDVLIGKAAQKARKSKIYQAMRLGNSSKLKVKIAFEDNKNKKIVETTIWGMTDKRVILKKGIVIPICRVHDINFF